MASRNILSAAEREYIVTRLARFMPPQLIVQAFSKRFPATSCNEQDVIALDPRESVVAPELHQLFYAERERVLSNPSLAVFADRAARIFALSQLAEFFLSTNRPEDARSVFRQIAEELNPGGKGGKDEPSGPVAPEDKPRTIAREIVDPQDPATAA